MPNAVAISMILGLYAAAAPICGYAPAAIALGIVAGFALLLGALLDGSRLFGGLGGTLLRWFGVRA